MPYFCKVYNPRFYYKYHYYYHDFYVTILNNTYSVIPIMVIFLNHNGFHFILACIRK